MPWKSLLPLFAAAALLSACASGATPGAMVPPLSEATLIAPNSGLRGTIAVGAVTGGTETNPMLASNISDADFAAALRQSLSTHAMLAVRGETYRLEARIVELERPSIGFSFEVKARVAYRLIRVADGRDVFANEIQSAFTATFSDAATGVERLRIANEGAARENVRLFLTALVAAEKANPQLFAPSLRPMS